MSDYVPETDQDVECPFCKECGFDLIGLKAHLMHDCASYALTQVLVRQHS